MRHPSLSKLLDSGSFPKLAGKREYEKGIEKAQRQMLLIQQGIYQSKRRVIIALEGFDAAGKGGAIRRLTESCDPRGVKVIPIGPPTPDEQGRHWLYRFWRDLPVPGTLAVFDRTWYGRVLVEKVEGLAPKPALKRAYDEINDFERLLVDDGVDLIKIFLAISRDEQLIRFEERLKDPYKHWKLGEPDVEARRRWDDYVAAADDMLERCDTARAHWHLVPANFKWFARLDVLKIVTSALAHHGQWMEAHAKEATTVKQLKRALKKLR